MTKAEAAALLGVGENAPELEVRQKYQSLYNEYQIRLTSAPTPALRQTYQLKLQELLEASTTLYPAFAADRTLDLPLAEPISTAGGRPTGGRPAAEGVRRAAERQPKPPADPGLPRSTIIASLIAIVFAGAFSFVTLRMATVVRRNADLQAREAKLSAALEALQKQVDSSNRSLFADRLKVKNVSSRAARITSAAFVYRDDKGVFQLVLSAEVNDKLQWTVPPGGTVQLDSDIGRGRLWDGPVLAYAFLVEYPGHFPYLYSGVWASDVDRLDKAVTFDLDTK